VVLPIQKIVVMENLHRVQEQQTIEFIRFYIYH
jgi:hypothetical protein